jgi:hypothetical protein
MWAKVASRKHTPLKIFPFGSNATEVMIYGLVAYTLTDGRKADVEWAARAEMAKDEEEWKMKFYQVYLVSHSGCHRISSNYSPLKNIGHCSSTKRKVVGLIFTRTIRFCISI